MKCIKFLILSALAMLTMTSSAMAGEVMDYNELTPTFEFEIKAGDGTKLLLATRLEYKNAKGNLAYKDIDCVLDKGFYSKTIACPGLPLIDIFANDRQISNGYGKFKVSVGDITNFSLPTGSHALRLLARAVPPSTTTYVRNLTIVDGRLVCVITAEDKKACDDACVGYGRGNLYAESQERELYTSADGNLTLFVRECNVVCICNWFDPEDALFLNHSKPSCP